MFDDGPTKWPIEPHTLAKHKILTKYLDAWVPILTRQSQRLGSQRSVTFVDGFAGPGIYEDGEPGSPVLSIQSVLARNDLPRPVHFYFIEHRQDRYDELCRQLASFRFTADSSPNVVVHTPFHGDCSEVILKLLQAHHPVKNPFGPALVFLDQFGYGAVPIELIHKILEHPQCEVLTYLEGRHLNRFLAHNSKDEARNKAFGDDRWRAATDLDTGKRIAHLRDLYRSS